MWPSPVGRPKRFQSPEQLWDECQGFFVWLEQNPLWEAKLVSFQGESVIERLPKMQVATLGGLQLYLGISDYCWNDYRRDENFSRVTTQVEGMIRQQKFTGAAAELLNANIIARDLGLSEKIQTDQKINVITSEPQTPEQWEAEHTE